MSLKNIKNLVDVYKRIKMRKINLFEINIYSDELPVYTIELLAKSKTIAEMQAIHLFNYKNPTIVISNITIEKLK